MNITALDCEMRLQQRYTRYFENIDVLVVLNGYGQTVGIFRGQSLAQNWLTLGNNGFQKQYGFQWKPPELLLNKARMHL